MRSLLLTLTLLALGCGAPQQSHGGVHVRMARPNEFPRPSTSGLLWFPDSCAAEGEPTPALMAPVAAFARAHLIRPIEARTGFRSRQVDVRLAETARREPDHFITELVIDARGRRGSLEVRQLEPGWGAADYYCMHVVRDGASATIVLEHVGGWIS